MAKGWAENVVRCKFLGFSSWRGGVGVGVADREVTIYVGITIAGRRLRRFVGREEMCEMVVVVVMVVMTVI